MVSSRKTWPSRLLWRGLILAHSVACASGLSAETPGKHEATAAVYDTVFRSVTKTSCKIVVCLLSIDGKGMEDAMFRRVKPAGRVRPAQEQDLILEDGAYRGFAQHTARIVDISRLTWVSDTEVVADVSELTTVLNSKLCRYRLTKAGDHWKVNQQDTRCTLS